MRILFLITLSLLLAGCSAAGPPVQVAGEWQGWFEPAMDTKTGLSLDLEQTESKLSGTYLASEVGALGKSTEEGAVEGTVSGDTVTFTLRPKGGDGMLTDELPDEFSVKVSVQGGKRVMAAIIDPGNQLTIKVELKEKK